MTFPNESAKFVYTRTYSRWIEEESRRETWEETVQRFLAFIEEERGELVPSKVFKKIEHYLLNFEVMPSMRALWAAGPAAKKDNTCMYNCAFQAVDSIEAFSECLYILMCGTGYGFSVEKKYIQKLPEIPNLEPIGSGIHAVEDSKKGWAESLKELLKSLYTGKDLDFDYSNIREKGSRLETMGGRASGPEPLMRLHNFVREVFNNAQGRKLTSLECHDIMNQIAEIVVVGGVRRSSEISLSDLDDKEMRNAKVGNFPLRRYMANNSAVYHEKPSATEFLKEWASLAASRSGERGIFNLEAAKNTAPQRRDSSFMQGTNPCFTGETKLLTEKGYKTFNELARKKDIKLVNYRGELCSGSVWSSGIKPVVKLKNSLGEIIECTEDHKFMLSSGESIQAKDSKNSKLMPYVSFNSKNDVFTKLGFIQGDGNLSRLNSPAHKGLEVNVGIRDQEVGLLFDINYNSDKKSYYVSGYNKLLEDLRFDKKILPERVLPETFNYWKDLEQLSFLRGLYSANGSIITNHRIAFKGTCYYLITQLQKILKKYNIDSYITTNKAKSVKFANGEYLCKESYDLNICKFNSIKNFAEKIGFVHEYKTTKLRDLILFKSPKIVSVKSSGNKEVFDFNLQDDTHWGVVGNGYVAHNCGEIMLRSMQFCNLSEVVVKSTDDLDDLLEKVECATWIGAIQSTFTKFPYIRKKWKKNCEEERLLGVSLTGQLDNVDLMTKDNLTALRKKAIKIARKASKILNINMPTSITCGKPSGTVSQLVDSASGCHPRYSEFYIRRYRISSTDPLLKMLKDQKVPMSPEKGQRKHEIRGWTADKVNTWVVEFPCKSPRISITRTQLSAIDQLEHYKLIQTNWCEHNQSMTVYVKDTEWFEVGNWVYKNWDLVSGVSFLPYDGGMYELAPYEEVSALEYKKLIEKFPKIDYSKLPEYELEDATEGAKSYACVGNMCELN